MQATIYPEHTRPERIRLSGGARPGLAGMLRKTCVLAACVVLSGLLLLNSRPCVAQPPTEINLRHEYNVKAVFLYSFGRYVTWPEGVFPARDTPFVIGVLGEDPFGGALDKIASTKTIHGRRIELQRWESLEEYKPCHILFLPRTTTAEQRSAVVRALEAKPVLLVGETPGFARQGGTVNYFLDRERVRFEINADAVKRQQLSVDAKLQKLATTVKEPQTRL